MRRRRATLIPVLVLVVAFAASGCSKDVDPDQALKEGLAQQQAGNLEAAAEQYQFVLDARPSDKYANYNLGVIEQADGRVQLAEGYYRAALDTDPRFVPAIFNLAIVRTKAGATQEAIDLYRQVIEIQSDYAAAHFNLGILYRAVGKPGLADTHLNQALALDPTLAARLTTEPVAPSSPATTSPTP
jgi:tetratricopeptide (TPR) repeat protein